MANLVQFCLVTDDVQTEIIPEAVQKLLADNVSIFDEPEGLQPQRPFDHTIPLIPGAMPVNVRPYRYTPSQKDEIENQVQEMLAKGIIQPSSSPFSSPVLLVKKKDGSWRFCVDYRHLNAITVKNKYPLPIIDELLDELAGAQWFTKLDLRAGYHQIGMHIEDEHKTAFQTHHGHFEFRVIPFGLTSAPATFQSVMNNILSSLLRKCVLVFVDDILIYSRTLEEHLVHLQTVFQILHKHQLKVKKSKCSFAQQKLAYLGHIISPNGVSTDSDKIAVVQSWPVPSSVKELRSFLGLAGYYRKFVLNYGILSKPLTSLLKKGQLYLWTSATDQAFQAIKHALVTAPVLAMPDFSIPFVVETDASDKGMGAVLMQNNHPITFLSKALGPRHLGLSTYEKESLAIMMAVDHWRPYLQHAEFFIKTDHRSLAFLDNQRLTTPWQHKALTKLLGLWYQIIYKKGSDNRVADALSRYPLGQQVELLALSVALPAWIQEVVDGYQQDTDACCKIQTLCINSGAVLDFSLKDGVLYYKNRIWIGNNTSL